MLIDREIINIFQQQKSWASSCKIQELDGFTMISTEYVLYMPCNWQDYEERKHKIIDLAQKVDYVPGMIIAGEPDTRALNTIRYDPSLPETMIFRGKVRRFKMEIQFIAPKVRDYLNSTICWEIEEPY